MIFFLEGLLVQKEQEDRQLGGLIQYEASDRNCNPSQDREDYYVEFRKVWSINDNKYSHEVQIVELKRRVLNIHVYK